MTRARWFIAGAALLLLLAAAPIGSVVTSAPVFGRGTAQDPIRVVGLSAGGNATTATALAANGANCAAGQAAAGVNASGAAEGCATYLTAETDPKVGDVTNSKWCLGTGTQVSCVASSPIPAACSAGQKVTSNGSALSCTSETDPTIPANNTCVEGSAITNMGLGAWSCGYPKINSDLSQENGQVPAWNGDAGVWTSGTPDPGIGTVNNGDVCRGTAAGKVACVTAYPIGDQQQDHWCTNHDGGITCVSHGVSQTCSTGEYAWWNGSGWSCKALKLLASDFTKTGADSTGWATITGFEAAGGAGATVAFDCALEYSVADISGGLALGAQANAVATTSYETTVFHAATLNTTAHGTADFCNSNDFAAGDGGCNPTASTTAADTVYRAGIRGRVTFGGAGSLAIVAHGAAEQAYTIKAGSWCRFDNAY